MESIPWFCTIGEYADSAPRKCSISTRPDWSIVLARMTNSIAQGLAGSNWGGDGWSRDQMRSRGGCQLASRPSGSQKANPDGTCWQSLFAGYFFCGDAIH